MNWMNCKFCLLQTTKTDLLGNINFYHIALRLKSYSNWVPILFASEIIPRLLPVFIDFSFLSLTLFLLKWSPKSYWSSDSQSRYIICRLSHEFSRRCVVIVFRVPHAYKFDRHSIFILHISQCSATRIFEWQ